MSWSQIILQDPRRGAAVTAGMEAYRCSSGRRRMRLVRILKTLSISHITTACEAFLSLCLARRGRSSGCCVSLRSLRFEEQRLCHQY